MTAPNLLADPHQQPPLDHELSPYTGYTRAHWEAAADRMLDALVPYASPHRAQYRLPGRTSHSGTWSDGLEGYARSFMLAACRIAGASGQDERGSSRIHDLIERYSAGLTTGTDTTHTEHWPPITDGAQSMVEAASIAIALHETRPWIWDQLSDPVRQRVAAWLGGFVRARPNDSNWRLFQVITEEFLASIGAPHSRAEIDGGLARLDDWYRGGGWYTDGDGQKFDYYNAWTLHLYPVLWARIAGPRADGLMVATHRERLHAFLESHQYFFGSNGAPIHQGRSLTYRFATAAPLWAGALANIEPLPPGRIRRLASGSLKHFADRGVPDAEGLLRLGWYRPYLPATQPYSGPASPYWASKAFLGLLLPADHVVWTAREEPSPVDTANRGLALPGPGWLLQSTAADGIVRLINHGSDRPSPAPTPEENPHYTRLAYSTVTAPETPPGEEPPGPDNQIALLNGPAPWGRTRIHRLYTQGRRAASWHTGPPSDNGDHARITTASVAHGPWEVRIHRVEAPAGTHVREGGWALADDDAPPTTESGPGWTTAQRRDGLTSTIVALFGWEGEGTSNRSSVASADGHNAYGRYSATPLLTARHPGGIRLLATLVVLTADPSVYDDPDALRTGTTAAVTDEGEVRVVFPDGTSERVRVEAPSPM